MHGNMWQQVLFFLSVQLYGATPPGAPWGECTIPSTDVADKIPKSHEVPDCSSLV